jgi:TonB family protein
MLAAALLFLTSFSAVELPENYGKALATRYPAWALVNRRSAWAMLDVLVRPDGAIVWCRVGDSFGSYRLAQEACAIVRPILLNPAKGPDGKPVYGRIKVPIRFFASSGVEENEVEQMKGQPDIELTVDRLPAATDEPPGFEIALLVQPDGTVSDCRANTVVGDSATAMSAVPQPLVDRACEQPLAKKRSPIKGADGAPTLYVDTLKVQLR